MNLGDRGRNFLPAKGVFAFWNASPLLRLLFHNQPPVHSTVHVSALPKGATIEIEVIAVADPIRGKAIDTWE